MPDRMGQSAGDVEAVIENKVEEPARYKVLMHNDNYTSMDFVVEVLCGIFHKNLDNARALMMIIHTQGIGECGIYTKEIAEAKVGAVRTAARKAGFPLRCTMEKE